MQGNIELRAALDDLFRAMFPNTFDRRWEALQRWPNSLKIIAERDDRFTCFAYSLGIEALPRYNALVDDRQHGALASSSFIEYLVKQGHMTEVAEAVFAPGRAVLYYEGERITHGARILSETLLASKWGSGKVYQHGLWEVPLSYGNQCKFVAIPLPDRAVELLEMWVEAHP